tara:strand:+ start:866 stop:2095 length:1230 start_codon:yes stop_codon:yes gene_type:complete
MADKTGYIGRNPGDSSVTVARQIFNPTGVQTDFTFSAGYVVGYFDLYLNGVRLVEGLDFSANDTTTFNLVSAAQNGDVVEGVAYKAFNLNDTKVGIQSSGTVIGSVNNLNFIGTGNTFLLNGNTIDVSISGGGAGVGGTWGNYDNNTGVTTTSKVKIQNDFEVTGVSTFTGFVAFTTSISVGGTVTYEDVTNVDSVGLITARNGVKVTTGGINVVAGGIDIDAGRLNIDAGGLNVAGGGANITGVTTLSSLLSVGSHASVSGVITATGSVQVGSGQSFGSNGASVAVFYGDGSNLTNLPATGITTEALVTSGIVTTLDLSNAQDHKVTATGICTITVTGGTEADSHTLRIINSGIATVGFSTYFLFASGGSPSLPTPDGSISLISFTVNKAGSVGVATELLAGASLNFS